MHYEIHITVKTTDIEKFKKDCEVVGVKPIVIETERQGVFEHQVMTSSKYNDENWNGTQIKLALHLSEQGYSIIRRKVEIKPEENKHSEFKYYETHFRLKYPHDFNRRPLEELCQEMNFHLSKNLFKKTEEYVNQMITYRSYYDSYTEFMTVIEKMREKLDELDIEYDKVEVEECIFDSNKMVDANWLN